MISPSNPLAEGEAKSFFLKDSLRAALKERLASLDGEYKVKASEEIAKRFLSNIHVSSAVNISAYYPIGNEVSTQAIIGTLWELGKSVSLPVMVNEDSPMVFREYKNGDVLCLDRIYRRISEPIASSKEVIPEIMILPLLAFDRQGYRLGYGRGYYDRTLGFLRKNGHNPVAVGIGYSSQLHDTVPFEKHDQQLDYVITENEVIKVMV